MLSSKEPSEALVMKSLSAVAPETESDSETEPEQGPDKKVAAGTAGAVIGMCFGGPIGSALLGFTAAYAYDKDDNVGDIARSLGDVALRTREKAIEVESKHKVLDRSKEAVTGVWDKTREYDQKLNILDKTKDGVVNGWTSFTKFVQEKRLLEQGVEKTGVAYEYVACLLYTSPSPRD